MELKVVEIIFISDVSIVYKSVVYFIYMLVMCIGIFTFFTTGRPIIP